VVVPWLRSNEAPGVDFVLHAMVFSRSVAVVLAALASGDAWEILRHDGLVVHGLQEVLASPALLLVMYPAGTLPASFHELGHASAARFDGVKAWVVVSILVLAGDLAPSGFLAPRVLPQLWHSAEADILALSTSVARADVVGASGSLFSLLIFTVFAAGSGFMAARVLSKALVAFGHSRLAKLALTA